jgi:glycerophosphoryl diester phosphodiesterase
MKIIGHRGAAGLALENSLASIRAALAAGVDAIEIDVRLTKDDQLVLCHDPDLLSVTGKSLTIRDLTLAEIRKLKTLNGEPVPTLIEALQTAAPTPIIIELKDPDSAHVLIQLLENQSLQSISVASFKHAELGIIKKHYPGITTYALEHTKPFDILHDTYLAGANGIGLNFWLLNPLTYWRARRRQLNVYVYTVNNPFLAWWLSIMYPRVAICTDYPNRLRPRRRKVA